jgi:hypothetical protein
LSSGAVGISSVMTPLVLLPAVCSWYSQHDKPKKKRQLKPIPYVQSPVAARTRSSLKRSFSKDDLSGGDLILAPSEGQGSPDALLLKLGKTFSEKYCGLPK